MKQITKDWLETASLDLESIPLMGICNSHLLTQDLKSCMIKR